MADQRHAVLHHGFAGLGQRAIAALQRGQVDDHAAWLHGLDHFLGHQHRCRTPWNQRGGDHHVGLRHAFGHFNFLPCHPARRHRFGVAAHAYRRFTFLIGFVGHLNELATQRLDLLFHARAHVAGFNHRAQALGRGNRLQTGHADAQNHHARRLHRAGGRHQHGKEALVLFSGHHHRLVACNIGLR